MSLFECPEITVFFLSLSVWIEKKKPQTFSRPNNSVSLEGRMMSCSGIMRANGETKKGIDGGENVHSVCQLGEFRGQKEKRKVTSNEVITM